MRLEDIISKSSDVTQGKACQERTDLKLISDYTYVKSIVFFPALIIHLKEKNRRREKRRKRELNFKALINFKTLA